MNMLRLTLPTLKKILVVFGKVLELSSRLITFINMNFRRIPFQFSTTDPTERQRELERRFGLPTNQNMYVDMVNPLSSGTIPKETSSPRLQHRVPIFAEGYDYPTNSSVDSMCPNSDNKKPNVRVIPIEIEGADSQPTTRHRTFSGPAGIAKNHQDTSIPIIRDGSSLSKNSKENLSKSTKATSAGPRVFNIPIKIEGANNSPKPKREKREASTVNGCHVSKSAVKSPEKEKPQEKKDNAADPIKEVLKKIENVLEEFVNYEKGVQEFQGTVKEKQYRYLDEMLTRCMLRLDEVDTMGNEELRMARKNAVRKIQASIDLLESKANSMNAVKAAEDNATIKTDTDSQDVEMKDLVQETNTQLTGEEKVNVEAQEDGGVKCDSQTEDSSAVNSKEGQCVVKEVDMSESKDNMQNTGENVCQVSDVDITEESKTNEEEVVNSENSGAALAEDVLPNKDSNEIEESNELPEVEMAEIVFNTPTKEPVKDTNEVEMIDSCVTGNPKPDEIIDTSESPVDVEMNDPPSDVPEMTGETSSSIQSLGQNSDQTVTVENSVIITEAKTSTGDAEYEQKTNNAVSDSCCKAGDADMS